MTFWKIRLHKYVQNCLKIWGTVEISVGFWFCLGGILFFRKLSVSWQQVCKAAWAGQLGQGLSALTLNYAWASQISAGSGEEEMGERVAEGFFWLQVFVLGEMNPTLKLPVCHLSVRWFRFLYEGWLPACTGTCIHGCFGLRQIGSHFQKLKYSKTPVNICRGMCAEIEIVLCYNSCCRYKCRVWKHEIC